MTVSTAVFGTAELFEEILSFLSMEELTRAQRVCRAWQDCIMTSPGLKRTLRFELEPGAIIPLLQQSEKTKFRRKVSFIVFEETSDPANPFFSCCPILRFAPPVKVRTEKRWHIDEMGRSRKDERNPVIVDVRDLLLRSAGTWEQMRLTQPPLTSLALQFSVVAAIGQSGGDFWDYMHLLKVDLENTEGIRIGDLLETVRSRMRDFEAETGEKVRMTSYCDATFLVPGHAFEGSKEVRKAFRHSLEPPSPPPVLGLDDLGNMGKVFDGAM